MGGLDEIINFLTFTDDGGAESTSINGHVLTDLNVILNDHMPDLRHLAVNAFIEHITKAIRTNDGASMDAHTISNLSSRVQRDMREHQHIIAKFTIRPDVIAGLQHRTSANPCMFADDAAWPTVSRGIDFCR